VKHANLKNYFFFFDEYIKLFVTLTEDREFIFFFERVVSSLLKHTPKGQYKQRTETRTTASQANLQPSEPEGYRSD